MVLNGIANNISVLVHDIIEFVTSLTRRVSLVEQELITVPKHLSSHRF